MARMRVGLSTCGSAGSTCQCGCTVRQRRQWAPARAACSIARGALVRTLLLTRPGTIMMTGAQARPSGLGTGSLATGSWYLYISLVTRATEQTLDIY